MGLIRSTVCLILDTRVSDIVCWRAMLLDEPVLARGFGIITLYNVYILLLMFFETMSYIDIWQCDILCWYICFPLI
jgi:hypothetical protein